MFLCETWLRQEDDTLIIRNISHNYVFEHRSSIEEYYQAGRPFGGIGWIFNKNLRDRIKIEFINNNTSTLIYDGMIHIIGTYLPTGKGPECYQNELLQITNTINNMKNDVLVIGDLNGDVYRPKPYRTDNMLKDWLREEERIHNLKWISQLYTQSTNCSYKNDQHQSMIDYVLLAKKNNQWEVDQVNILNHDHTDAIANNSDHTPSITTLRYSQAESTNKSSAVNNTTKLCRAKESRQTIQIDWDSIGHKTKYEMEIIRVLKRDNFMGDYCLDSMNKQEVDAMTDRIFRLIQEARENTIKLIQTENSASHIKKRREWKDWWNKDLEQLHQLKIKYNKLWLQTRNPHYRRIYNYYRSKARREEKQAARKSVDRKAKELSRKFKKKKLFWKAIEEEDTEEMDAEIDAETLKKAYTEDFNNKILTMDKTQEISLQEANQKHYEEIVANKCIRFCALKTTQGIIKSLKRNKASSVSKITNEEIKFGGKGLAIAITHLINCCLITRHVPSTISIGLIFPIVKDQKKDRKNIENTRPITLSEPLASIIEKYLLTQIEENFVEEPTQFGFRRSSSTGHAIFTLRETLMHHKEKNKSIVVCFLDFSKAFDKVNRPKLFDKLKTILDDDHWAILYSYYTSTHIRLRDSDPTEAPIKTTIGVKQGGPLSPKLFAIYVNNMIRQVNESKLTCKLGEIETGVLLYADDTVVCTNTIADLNTVLNQIDAYCNEHEIKINTNKTKAIVVNQRLLRDSTTAIKIGENIIEKVPKFKYLGWWIEANMQNKEHLKSRKMALLAAASKLRKLGLNSQSMSLEVKTFLFETYCRSTSQYGLANTHLTHKDLADLGILEGKIIKVAFGLTKYHSTTTLYNAIKITPLDELIKIRKLQSFLQLLKFDVTARIIEQQINDESSLSNKSLMKYILTTTERTNQHNTIDLLTTTVMDKISTVKEQITKDENTKLANGINYLLKNNNVTNHSAAKKMLSWENRPNLLKLKNRS